VRTSTLGEAATGARGSEAASSSDSGGSSMASEASGGGRSAWLGPLNSAEAEVAAASCELAGAAAAARVTEGHDRSSATRTHTTGVPFH
jgi:hypothetical protein